MKISKNQKIIIAIAAILIVLGVVGGIYLYSIKTDINYYSGTLDSSYDTKSIDSVDKEIINLYNYQIDNETATNIYLPVDNDKISKEVGFISMNSVVNGVYGSGYTEYKSSKTLKDVQGAVQSLYVTIKNQSADWVEGCSLLYEGNFIYNEETHTYMLLNVTDTYEQNPKMHLAFIHELNNAYSISEYEFFFENNEHEKKVLSDLLTVNGFESDEALTIYDSI